MNVKNVDPMKIVLALIFGLILLMIVRPRPKPKVYEFGCADTTCVKEKQAEKIAVQTEIAQSQAEQAPFMELKARCGPASGMMWQAGESSMRAQEPFDWATKAQRSRILKQEIRRMQDLAEQAELYRRTRKVADEKNYTASVVYRIEKLTEYAQQRAAGQEKEAGLAKK